MLGACSRPVIAVDWSDLDGAKRHFLLRASLIIQGRALTLYEEVHTLATKEKRRTHGLFLRQLQGIVGVDTRAILASNRCGACSLTRGSGRCWRWVGTMSDVFATGIWCALASRRRGLTPKRCMQRLPRSPRSWARLSSPVPSRCTVASSWYGGPNRVAANGPSAVNARTQGILNDTPDGRVSRGYWSPRCQHTRSVQNRIVRLYAQRMQIEEAFRDLKSERFGLGFEVSRSTDTHRIAVLLLIAMLTLLLAWLIGKSVELLGQHRRYQANTERRRRVLSTTYIGRRAVHDARLHINTEQFIAAAQHLATLVHNAFNHG